MTLTPDFTQSQLDDMRASTIETAKRLLDQGRPLAEVSVFLHRRDVDLENHAVMYDLEYDGRKAP